MIEHIDVLETNKRRKIAMNNELLNNIITLLIIPILPTVAGFIIFLIKAKMDEIKARGEDQEYMKYLNTLETAVCEVVNSLQQTVVDEIKAANEDHKLTKEEAAKIKNEAVTKVLKIVGEYGLIVLEDGYGDVKELVENKIESYIKNNKRW